MADIGGMIGGNLLRYLFEYAAKLFRQDKHRRRLKKLQMGKAEHTEWTYGEIPTECDLCSGRLGHIFVTGWGSQGSHGFEIICPDCYEKNWNDLRDIEVYNLETLEKVS
jgi:hypothetical protein